jgi:hypothetical protein
MKTDDVRKKKAAKIKDAKKGTFFKAGNDNSNESSENIAEEES